MDLFLIIISSVAVIVCGEDQYVSNHTCQDCDEGHNRKAGDTTDMEDTDCHTKNVELFAIVR